MHISYFSHRPTGAWIAVSAVATVLALAACGQAAQGPSAAAAPAAPQVRYIVVQPQRVALTSELPGRTSPVEVADVRPQITGLVQTRKFVEGSEVKAGELLYQVDPASYRATVDSAQAALAKAQATLVSTKLQASRYKELVAIKAVSQQEADNAAATELQGEADVASAKAALQTAKINLDYTRIVAPIGGRIGRSSVTVGALVTANQTAALATVQKLNPMYVDITQSSSALLVLRRAQAQGTLGSGTAKVTLRLEDGSTYPLDGKLKFTDVTVDQTTGAVTLRAEFPNPHAELLPGMYVRAVLAQAVAEQALLVPQPAVSRDSTGKPVAFVVAADGKLEQRTLVTDRAIGDQWLVTSGLQAGDKLVVEGQQKAKPGAAVDAKPMAVAEPAKPASAASAAVATN
ncbi:MAG: efflux RND transporter periplasmic adaptor subunit [Rhodoferax sp.]|uniref:efflux RND transporter periplasmic adaptor subunit n=1 Tax=Rhodoferax sp. TaxID=50421 RepID=UPI00326693A1